MALTKAEVHLLNHMTPGAHKARLGSKVAAAIAASAPATATTSGTVLKAGTVANATDAATAITQLNALIASLRAAGTIT